MIDDVQYDLDQYQSIKNQAIIEFYKGNFENSLDYTRVAALYAWQSNCGIWYDDDLDYLLKLIGIYQTEPDFTLDNDKDSNKIVYITSAINVGGLTRLLNQWMSFLNDNFKSKKLFFISAIFSNIIF